MITRVTGNILEANADLIYIPVNRVGVMGAGLAKEFKAEYPELYREYKDMCENTDWLYTPSMSLVFVAETPLFVMFPTKDHWQDKSDIRQIEAYLRYQFYELHQPCFLMEDNSGLGVEVVAIPPLGAGLGGLDTDEVLDMIERVWKESGQDEVRDLLLYTGR